VTAAEITALASGAVAVISALAALFGVISHLSWHDKQEQQQPSGAADPPGTGLHR
jgi:hypothetical protein